LPFRDPLVPLDACRVCYNYVALERFAELGTRFGDLEMQPFELARRTSTRFDYAFFVAGHGERLTIVVLYNSELFEEASARDLLAEFVGSLGPGRGQSGG